MTLTLRPHHILCLQGFQGLGYDAAFTANLAHIHQKVYQSLETPVRIVAGIDAICKPCPHHHQNQCVKTHESQSEMQELDQKVLELLDLQLGHETTAQEIFKGANARLKSKNDVKNVCGLCSWNQKCGWYLSRD